jgi:ABC-type multidrug transport system ATPase subunit
VIERPEALGRIGFVAQDAPLYRGFTAQEMLRLGARLTGAGISSSRSSGWSGSGSR